MNLVGSSAHLVQEDKIERPHEWTEKQVVDGHYFQENNTSPETTFFFYMNIPNFIFIQ